MRALTTPAVGLGVGLLLLLALVGFALLPAGGETGEAPSADRPTAGPPSWARGPDAEKERGRPEEKGPPPGLAKKAEQGHHHGSAMRTWAHCVAEAAREHDDGAGAFEPEEACGQRPTPPGHAGRED